MRDKIYEATYYQINRRGMNLSCSHITKLRADGLINSEMSFHRRRTRE